MPFESVLEKSLSTGRGCRLTDGDLSISKHYQNSVNNKAPVLCFRIRHKLMAEYRLIHGDRADILIDRESSLGLIKRVKHPFGRCVSLSGQGKAKNSDGMVRFRVKKDLYDAIEIDGQTALENVVVNDDGILFTIPLSKHYREKKTAG